ncbi:MAG TPA: rod shape-determining protein RodA [Verrucomicrobiae bacterium]|nr:rod shape-determining protein RodA [Verrucomicrobiae bacterium]
MQIKPHIDALTRMDWLLFGAMVALAAGSVAFVYSASYHGPGQPVPNYYKLQMVWFAAGLALYAAATLIDYRVICQWAAVWYAMALGLLVVVLLVGNRVHGSKSWLGFAGLGIQPAEFAKLAVIVAIAYYLFHRTPEMRRRWPTVWGSLALVSAPVVLILAQPDLGSAIVLIPICFGLMFVSGVRGRHLVIVIVLGLAVMPSAWFKLKEYQKSRLTVFLDPNKDPLGAGWNLNQSLIAVGSGGLTGKGYLQGTQNLLGYLPRTVTPNDFLFSVIAEEKGFVGSACVVGLYAVLLFSGLRIAAHARDRLGMLLATGVVAMLFFHVFINVGMTIGLMPITGLPLPLLSYGGSFVLASMTALGLLQNVWIHRRVY